MAKEDDIEYDYVPAGFDWKHPNYDEVYRLRAKKLQFLRDNPDHLAAIREFYKTHPAIFINDWGLTSDPRNAEVGLPVEVPFILFPKQVEFIEWLYARWRKREDGLAEKSRDMGCSWLSIAFGVWMWLFHGGSVIGYGSRKEVLCDSIGDPKSLFWKARQFIAMLPPEFRPEKYNEQKHAPVMRIINPENGSAMIAEAGMNVGRGARASMYFLDEAAFYEQPEAIDAALSQSSNCKIAISTPNGVGNTFFIKRHSGRMPVFVFDWHDDPRKDQAWYDHQVAALDPVIVAQEIDRNYESSVSNVFMHGEIVGRAGYRGPADVQPIGGLRVGVDVARFGDDKTVISFRRGRVLLKQAVLAKLDVMDVASIVKREVMAYKERPEQIAVDTIGIGAGVADILRAWFPDKENKRTGRMEKVVVDVNSASRLADGQHYNLRAYMWAQMKEWMPEASIPNDPDLRSDLTALRYGFKGGELLIESKDDAKRRGVKSPDRADSLALTFAVPTVAKPDRRPTRGIKPFKPLIPGLGCLG